MAHHLLIKSRINSEQFLIIIWANKMKYIPNRHSRLNFDQIISSSLEYFPNISQ
jgi:hypothetical protein